MRNTGPSSKTRGLVLARSGGRCERCRQAPVQQIHHRLPRGMGGTRNPRINDLDNLTGLCAGCHAWVESNRTLAKQQGWLLDSSWRNSPTLPPIPEGTP